MSILDTQVKVQAFRFVRYWLVCLFESYKWKPEKMSKRVSLPPHLSLHTNMVSLMIEHMPIQKFLQGFVSTRLLVPFGHQSLDPRNLCITHKFHILFK